MMEELKNCPFCGGKAEILEDYFHGFSKPDYVAVQCNTCFSCTHTFLGWQDESKKKAIEAWNTRA